jgi:hypothetical protein
MRTRAVAGLALGVVFFLLFLAILFTTPGFPAGGGVSPASPGSVLWNMRTVEVLAQGFILLAGAVAILLMLGNERNREAEP